MTYRSFRRQGNQNNTSVSKLSKCIKIMTFCEVCFEIIDTVECKYFSEATDAFITISFTKDERISFQSIKWL